MQRVWIRTAVACALLATLGPVAPVAGAEPASIAESTNWSTYRHDNARSGFSATETAITAGSVGSLAPHWVVPAPDSISTEAVIANGLLYWGSWDGYEHASDPLTGADLWAAYAGQETKADCSPPHAGVGSTATVASVDSGGATRSMLFVGGGNGTFYALDALTGAVLWTRFFGSPQEGYFLWSSPALFEGSLFMGIASIGDCPLIHGQLVKMDAASGTLQQVFDAVPDGCLGGGIWSSPTIDEATGVVYVSTGTTGECGGTPEPYGQGLLALSTKDLAILGVWAPPAAEQVPDGDFGATPTLFTATIDGSPRRLVGAANKNGIYYAFDRTNVGAGPQWQSERLSSNIDTFATSAWDGARLYVAAHETTINGAACEASMRALEPATGAFLWQDCLSGGGADGALTAVPGVVFMGIGSRIYAVDATSGGVLFTYQDTSYHWFWAPCTISRGVLYIGNSNGNLYAFTPNGT